MHETEEKAKRPAGATEHDEAGVVQQREHEPIYEMDGIADHLCACAVIGEGGPEQEWNIHSCQTQLSPRRERRGEDERSREAAGESGPHAHRDGSCIAIAALINARWTRPCGRFPRNAADAGSISS